MGERESGEREGMGKDFRVKNLILSMNIFACSEKKKLKKGGKGFLGSGKTNWGGCCEKKKEAEGKMKSLLKIVVERKKREKKNHHFHPPIHSFPISKTPPPPAFSFKPHLSRYKGL